MRGLPRSYWGLTLRFGVVVSRVVKWNHLTCRYIPCVTTFASKLSNLQLNVIICLLRLCLRNTVRSGMPACIA